MSTDSYALASTVIMILPMLYFLFASITFLFARMSDPVVTWLLRGLFNTYFLALVGCGALGAAAFLSAGRGDAAGPILLLAALGLAARRWFLARLDAGIRARDAGEPGAAQGLRRLHLGGMAYNAVQTAVAIGSIRHLFPSA